MFEWRLARLTNSRSEPRLPWSVLPSSAASHRPFCIYCRHEQNDSTWCVVGLPPLQGHMFGKPWHGQEFVSHMFATKIHKKGIVIISSRGGSSCGCARRHGMQLQYLVVEFLLPMCLHHRSINRSCRWEQWCWKSNNWQKSLGCMPPEFCDVWHTANHLQLNPLKQVQCNWNRLHDFTAVGGSTDVPECSASLQKIA